jgi:hypothetical protein
MPFGARYGRNAPKRKKPPRIRHGGFPVFGGQLQKQNGRPCGRPFVQNTGHRDEENIRS